MRRGFAISWLAIAIAVPVLAERRNDEPQAASSGSSPAPLQTASAEISCPAPLGVGMATKEAFCDVLTGRNPADGIIVKLPPHSGPVTLRFLLHNRHTYSEEEMRQRSAFRRYTATIGVLTMDNTLLGRAVVQNEFRSVADLVDRVDGGAGPGGVKAVAPTGAESIAVVVPEAENRVSLLGEKLIVEGPVETVTYTQPGRPVADVSRVMVEYRAPVPHPAGDAQRATRRVSRSPGAAPRHRTTN
jgi:hypothetical protein